VIGADDAIDLGRSPRERPIGSPFTLARWVSVRELVEATEALAARVVELERRLAELDSERAK
jgi:hypothetical protein